MMLGQRIKEARLASGLSQRALCGDRLTRNMLSQIENGSARPSMGTLEYLARRLDKPISYFLDEQQGSSPNAACMDSARTALEAEDLPALRQALDAFREPDGMFGEEKKLLEFIWHLRRGEQAIREDAPAYAVTLLRRAEALEGLYITAELHSRCRVLLGLAGEPVAADCDEILLLRAAQADAPQRRLEILSASENREDPRWNLLRGEALFALERYGEAADCYRKCEQTRQVFARLEICSRELGDYKSAYEYACRQR